ACQSAAVLRPLLDQQKLGTIGNLNLEQLNNLEIPLPDLSEQRRGGGGVARGPPAAAPSNWPTPSSPPPSSNFSAHQPKPQLGFQWLKLERLFGSLTIVVSRPTRARAVFDLSPHEM